MNSGCMKVSACSPNNRSGDLLRLCCILFVMIASPQPAPAQPPSPQRHVVAEGPVEMTVELDKVDARIADPIMLRVQVDAPRGTLITFPLVDDKVGQFSVIDADTVRDLPLQGVTETRRWIATIELESLESGELKIPPLEVLYRLPDSFAVQGAREMDC